MSEWSMRPKVCSECGASIPEVIKRGPPRTTCTTPCALRRYNRHRREKRKAAAANAKYLADNAEFFRGTP